MPIPTSKPGTKKYSTPRAPNAPHTLMEATELRYKDILDAAKVFNLSKQTYRQN